MNYIGSKYKLLEFIQDNIIKTVGADLSDKVFCDLFAGTGAVGKNFKSKTKKIISNDIELYSYILNKNYIENVSPLRYENLINELNNIEGNSGFISEEYSENGRSSRLYFTQYNGKKMGHMHFTHTSKLASSLEGY